MFSTANSPATAVRRPGQSYAPDVDRHAAGEAVGHVERAVRDRRVLLVLVLLGAALRIWQYAADTSLWLDEISVARNIFGLSTGDLLLRPLAFDQVAPRGFLLVEKLAVLAFGERELALRLFPLLAGLAALVLFRRLAERTLDGLAVPFAVALFAVGIPFIRYSAEVKQYGIDATATIALTLLAVHLRERDLSTRRLLLAGFAGLLLVSFSQAAVLVMAGLGAALAVSWLAERDRRTMRALTLTVPVWAIAALLGVVAGLRSMTPATRQFMNEFWRLGFFPLPPQSPRDLLWFWDRIVQLFGDPWTLRYPWPAVFVVLAVVGVCALWRRRRDVALILAAPVALTLVAAVAHQYPFRTRLVVFLLPGMLLVASAGAEWLRRTVARRSPALGAALMAGLLAAPAVALAKAPLPLRVEDYRPLFAHLQAHRRPGDAVYVFPIAQSGAIFYGPRYGLQRAEWTLGVCDRDDARPFIRDVDQFRGVRRLWVLTTGPAPLRAARAAVRGYLGTIGVRRDSLVTRSIVFTPMSLELYDLSDPERLRAASADAFPVPPMPSDQKPGCRDWSGAPRGAEGPPQ